LRQSESQFLDIRGLRYHLRRWPRVRQEGNERAQDGAGPLVLLHGWMDVSASFQFLADAMSTDREIVAPDWRGYGLSEWARTDCYWFPDYIADLDRLLDALQPDRPVDLVGHSLGGNVAALYAGIRPGRVAKLVNLEGFGMPLTRPEQAPKRYARWLDELRVTPQLRAYASFGELADRLQKNNPRLSRERAEFLAGHWGRADGDGRVVLRSDPAHKIVNANLSRFDEIRACWSLVSAPVLWVDAADSEILGRMGITAEQYAERRAAFRNLRYVTLQDAGHMLHHDQPEQTARLIEEFVGADA
jgi:pimeloyl-ACP methyl ester carboxylesterase